jgi:phosphohistidine phosphatase
VFLYLVQHGDAKREEEDPARPLSEKGLRDITGVASYISQLDIKVYKIFHSTKLRARQTAEVLSGSLNPAKGMSEVDGLSPMDDPDVWAGRLKDVPDNIILVGHLPHLSRLASLLLCGNADRNPVLFRMAGVVCLRKDDNAVWSLQWMLTPEIVPGEKGAGSCDGL